MKTLMDRAFGTFTSQDEASSTGADGESSMSVRVNGDVLAAVCSIPKGLRLLTRLVPLLPHDGTWTSAHEMTASALANGQRISQICPDPDTQKKLVSAFGEKFGEMDLLAVRNILKHVLEQQDGSEDKFAPLFSPIGCGMLLGLLTRGQHCMS